MTLRPGQGAHGHREEADALAVSCIEAARSPFPIHPWIRRRQPCERSRCEIFVRAARSNAGRSGARAASSALGSELERPRHTDRLEELTVVARHQQASWPGVEYRFEGRETCEV
jgi:hypothetical protein